MPDEFEQGPGNLLLPKGGATKAEASLRKKSKDFLEKAVEDPVAIDAALRLAAEKDLEVKTKILLDTLPDAEPDLERTPGFGELHFLDEMFTVKAVSTKTTTTNRPIIGEGVKSDGGSTSYYEIPPDARELNDLIEHKRMSFALGNIFKACYRLGEKDGTDIMYDLNKIVFFAERLKAYVAKNGRLP